MIGIEENGVVEFETYNTDDCEEDIIYNYLGGTIIYAEMDGSTKLMMKIKIKNVGTDLLSDINIKRFDIRMVDECDPKSYSLIVLCDYQNDETINNAILPGVSSKVNFIFDALDETVVDDSIFSKYFKENLEINISFEIKLKNEEVITEEILLNCSSRANSSKSYKFDYVIDYVTTTFHEGVKEVSLKS